MKLIMENWDRFVIQEQTLEPATIFKVGDLLEYIKGIEAKGQMQKVFGKFAKPVAVTLGALAGMTVANPVGGAAVGLGAEQITGAALAKLLGASVVAFSNLDDSTPHPPGSAAFYFDMNDQMQLFFRHLETKGKDLKNPSEAEKIVLDQMIKKIKDGLDTDSYAMSDDLSTIFGNMRITNVAQNVGRQGRLGGKVDLAPISNP